MPARRGAGRKPKPTAIKILEGNKSRRPLPQNEPVIMALEVRPDPPPFLSDEAIEEWHRQLDYLHGSGVLTRVDVPALAAFCQAYGRWAQAEAELAAHRAAWAQMPPEDRPMSAFLCVTPNGAIQQHVLVGVANTAARDMMRYAAELGITPSARTRVQAAPKANGQKSAASKYLE